MSNIEIKEPYVYQPYGMQDFENFKTGRLYAIAGLCLLTTIDGLTKEEAEKILAVLKRV